MKNYPAKIALLSLIAAGLAVPVLLRAQDSSTNSMSTAAAPEMAPAKPAKHRHNGAPFHGTLDDLDTNAMTFTVGSRTFGITSKTKITKDGKPAILADGVVGQPVSGYYHTNESGGLEAVTIHFGAHAKHKHASPDSTTSTNSVSGN